MFMGIPLSTPNRVTQADGFYVSFNDVDHNIYGADTTALVKGQMDRFYILNDDHVAAYQALIPQGFDACLAYFVAHIDQINKRSDRPDPVVANA